MVTDDEHGEDGAHRGIVEAIGFRGGEGRHDGRVPVPERRTDKANKRAVGCVVMANI